MRWWYLSFVVDDVNAGACTVEADDAAGAVEEATRRGCNPGGEVMAVALPVSPPPGWPNNRLIPRDELIGRWGGVRLGDMNEASAARLEDVAELVCEDCNEKRLHVHREAR